ncbi:nuclear pore complex protein Nup88-like, partial [Amphibalanus amphitrite]
SHQVAERFFLCTKHVQVTKVRWHPESAGDCHLVVLCSDNYLRVYDVSSDLQTPSQALPLGATHSASLGGRPGSSFVRSLGEVAVSFAFGNRPPPPPPPADGQDQQKEDLREPLPVYILRGNGDIYITCINLAASRERFQVLGPVAMHPAAEDNYGTDACDLLCVGGGSPAVLVVATPTRLYHCVVLDRPADEADDGVASEASWSRYSSCLSLEPAAISLYVYESVEPDMVLAPADDDDAMTSPIRLHRDPASDCRYFCSHAAGVHAVAMPLIAALERFASQPETSDEPLGEHPCIVEHLVSTRPVSSAPACPVIGLSVIPHPLLMVVLLATHEVLLLPLVAKFRPPAPTLAEEDESAGSVGPAQESESFSAHIRRLLERGDSVPVLRAAAEPASSAERLELASRAAHRLRTEYIQRQQLARAALQQQTDALRRLQQQQLSEAHQLEQQQQRLHSRALEIVDRWRQLEESHRTLLDRAETVFRRCQQGVPVLSDAERAVSRELKELGDMSELQARLDALQAKFDYQKRQVSLQQVNEQRQDQQLAALSSAQRTLLKTELAAQGDQIAALVQTVLAARKTLGV